MIAGLRVIPGVKVTDPAGAFYAFPDASAFIGKQGIATDLQLAERILEGGVALVPGSGFLAPGFLRRLCLLQQRQLDERTFPDGAGHDYLFFFA